MKVVINCSKKLQQERGTLDDRLIRAINLIYDYHGISLQNKCPICKNKSLRTLYFKMF